MGGDLSVHLSTTCPFDRSALDQLLLNQSTLIFEISCLKSLTHSAHYDQTVLPIRPAATLKDPGQGRFPLGACRRHRIKKGTGESQNAKQR